MCWDLEVDIVEAVKRPTGLLLDEIDDIRRIEVHQKKLMKTMT